MASSGKRFQIAGWMVAATWAATLAVFYWDLGGWLAQAVEGQDRSLISSMPLYLAAVFLIVALVITVQWARSIGASADPEAPSPAGVGRRRFLAGFAVGIGGIVGSLGATLGRNLGWVTVTGPNIPVDVPFAAEVPRDEWKGARVASYRRLGRTGFEVSDISLGSTRIRGELGEQTAQAAIERGINYFDTAPDYSEAGSETALGRAMKGHRDGMFLATKFCTPQGNLPAGTSVAHYMEAIDESLRRLQTDYVDLVHIHSCDTIERLMDPNAHEAFDRLKQAGKVRWLGFSSHTPNLAAVANKAIESDAFDVMMLAYHHGAWPTLNDIVHRARQADIGVVAMKTLKGAKHKGLLESRAEQDSYTQAAFKWVLSNDDVSCLVVSFREPSNLDEYLYASGKGLTAGDQDVLRKYDGLIAGKHCYQHCGACLSSCPEGLPIDDVLRFKMYFEDYGDEREAMRQYAKLPVKADACEGCSAPCANACPFEIPIAEATSEAHRLLTLA